MIAENAQGLAGTAIHAGSLHRRALSASTAGPRENESLTKSKRVNVKRVYIRKKMNDCFNPECPACKAKEKKCVIDWTLPIATVSESNARDHWSKRAYRARAQRQHIWVQWRNTVDERDIPIQTPCIIRISRISTRFLDDDNLRGALKSVRDGIADCINPGRAPGRSDNIEGMSFEYAQEKGKPKEKAVRIQIFC